jgi:hypothetical protein
MKRFILLLLSIAFATNAESAPQESLQCTLRGPLTFPWGSTPLFEVELLNQTDTDIYLVGSLDGSDVQWRYPQCYFEVIGPDGKSAVVNPARCGNINPLRKSDFVLVPAAGVFDPFQEPFFYPLHLNAMTFREPGEYRVRFVYSTASDDIRRWNHGIWADEVVDVAEDAGLLSLLAQVPKTRVVSNELNVRITRAGD